VPATRLDLEHREVELGTGEPIAFDGLILATGSSAGPWPGVPLPPAENVLQLRSLDDALALRDAVIDADQAVVLGAGFIGCEVAATLRGRGCNVCLVDVAGLPMARLGRTAAQACARMHADNGVNLCMPDTVECFVVRGSRVVAVDLRKGGELPTDVVLVATGARPNTSWLRGSGLQLEPGVVCRATCEAIGARDVLAAGDVAAFPHRVALNGLVRIEHWSNAAEQARVAAANLLAVPEERRPYAPVPSFWSDQYGVKIQAVGLPALADEEQVVEGSLDDGRFVVALARQNDLVGAVGFNAAARMPWYRHQLSDPPGLDALRAELS
jgi:3-phenylpropionate/trans-cinnamate dioxygenase ferredoxin reductase subunit